MQSYENHRQRVPVMLAICVVFLFAFLWQAYQLFIHPSVGVFLDMLVAAALVLLPFVQRRFTLRVQDRLIRLEMRLRLAALAPDLAARFGEFTVNQLCSLRFAGDGELPDLARKVLAERLDDRKAIKRQIRDWQGDYWRV